MPSSPPPTRHCVTPAWRVCPPHSCPPSRPPPSPAWCSATATRSSACSGRCRTTTGSPRPPSGPRTTRRPFAPSPTFAPQTDLASHNQTDLLSHNDTALLSPDQSAGANSQQGGFNLGFGDIVLGGSKTTANGDGAVAVSGHVHGSIVSGDGAVLGNDNNVNNGDVWAGTGSNVSVGHGGIEDHGTTNTGSGSVIKDNGGSVFQDVDASGGHGGGASGGDSLIGIGSGNSHGGDAGGGGIIVVNKDTTNVAGNQTHVGGDSDSGNSVSSPTHTVTESHTTTTVSDYSDHSSTAVVDNSTQHSASVFDNSHDTSLTDSTLDNSHDLALASGNHLLGF